MTSEDEKKGKMLYAEIQACLHVTENYVGRIDEACREYYKNGTFLFPDLSRAEDEDVYSRCQKVVDRLSEFDSDLLTEWNNIKYPSGYDQQIERMRDVWIRRRNYLRGASKNMEHRLEIKSKSEMGASTVTNYNITIKDVVGPVNVLSSLDKVIQKVQNAPSLASDKKEIISSLIEELKLALASAPASEAEAASLVTEQAQSIADELSKDSPRPAALKIKASGLIEAAKALSIVVPKAIEVAGKIAAFVAGVFP